MTSYVIFVDFRLKPGTRAQFRNAIDATLSATGVNDRIR